MSKSTLDNVTDICSFCDPITIEKQKIIDNQFAVALLPKKPVIRGHILIIPKRHVMYVTDLLPAELVGIQTLMKDFLSVFTTHINVTGFNITNNNGIDASQHVPHVHFHVFFRSHNDVSPFDILAKKAPQYELTEEGWKEHMITLRELVSETKK